MSSSLYISINETRTVYRVDLSLEGKLAFDPRRAGGVIMDTGLNFTLVENDLLGALKPEGC
jgi:hypothetical protein